MIFTGSSSNLPQVREVVRLLERIAVALEKQTAIVEAHEQNEQVDRKAYQDIRRDQERLLQIMDERQQVEEAHIEKCEQRYLDRLTSRGVQ